MKFLLCLPFLYFLTIPNQVLGQRFSFLLEGGAMRTQIHGDKLTGFHKRGLNFGIGTNYLIDNSNFITVKTYYYNQGSIKDFVGNRSLRNGVQMEITLNSIGVEFSYKYVPPEKNRFMGTGLVLHRLIAYADEVYYRLDGVDFIDFNSNQINSTFVSVKMFYGYTFFERFGFYLAFEGGITSLLDSPYYNVTDIKPYSFSLNFYVDIVSAQSNEKKKRKVRRRR